MSAGRDAPPPPAAFLVVDKPAGPTSHDVVGWARRALGTRAVGHSGTLDPFATGVLVLCVGEATKLASYVMAADKEYEAVLALGTETDTLDAEGAVTGEAPVPALEDGAVVRIASSFVGVLWQVPPVYSAIKTEGVPHYERARRGEEIAPAAREVSCHALDVLETSRSSVRFRVRCGAGYYVRALGRDLARALGTVGHLSALRRTRSGAHVASAALPGEVLRRARDDGAAREAVSAALLHLAPETSPLPVLTLEDAAVAMLRVGKRPTAPATLAAGPALAFDAARAPVAIVERDGETLRSLRGFAWKATAAARPSEPSGD